VWTFKLRIIITGEVNFVIAPKVPLVTQKPYTLPFTQEYNDREKILFVVFPEKVFPQKKKKEWSVWAKNSFFVYFLDKRLDNTFAYGKSQKK